jgi:hypothetical protein
MALPLVPLLIGVGVVAVAAGGKKRRGKALGTAEYNYFGSHNNVLVATNAAGVLRAGVPATDYPLVIVVAGFGATAEQLDEAGETIMARAESHPQVKFFWFNDARLNKQAAERGTGASVESQPNVAFAVVGASSKQNFNAVEVAAGASSIEAIDGAVATATGYAGARGAGGNLSRDLLQHLFPPIAGRRRAA